MSSVEPRTSKQAEDGVQSQTVPQRPSRSKNKDRVATPTPSRKSPCVPKEPPPSPPKLRRVPKSLSINKSITEETEEVMENSREIQSASSSGNTSETRGSPPKIPPRPLHLSKKYGMLAYMTPKLSPQALKLSQKLPKISESVDISEKQKKEENRLPVSEITKNGSENTTKNKNDVAPDVSGMKKSKSASVLKEMSSETIKEKLKNTISRKKSVDQLVTEKEKNEFKNTLALKEKNSVLEIEMTESKGKGKSVLRTYEDLSSEFKKELRSSSARFNSGSHLVICRSESEPALPLNSNRLSNSNRPPPSPEAIYMTIDSEASIDIKSNTKIPEIIINDENSKFNENFEQDFLLVPKNINLESDKNSVSSISVPSNEISVNNENMVRNVNSRPENVISIFISNDYSSDEGDNGPVVLRNHSVAAQLTRPENIANNEDENKNVNLIFVNKTNNFLRVSDSNDSLLFTRDHPNFKELSRSQSDTELIEHFNKNKSSEDTRSLSQITTRQTNVGQSVDNNSLILSAISLSEENRDSPSFLKVARTPPKLPRPPRKIISTLKKNILLESPTSSLRSLKNDSEIFVKREYDLPPSTLTSETSYKGPRGPRLRRAAMLVKTARSVSSITTPTEAARGFCCESCKQVQASAEIRTEERCAEDADQYDSEGGLTSLGRCWHRLHVSKAKLRSTSATSELFAAFAMVALVELQINTPCTVPDVCWVLFATNTTLLVGVNILALMVSTFILPSLHVVTRLHPSALVAESPHDTMRVFIETAWAFSTFLNLLLSIVNVALISWVKFWDIGVAGAITSTAIVVPSLVIFVLAALHFYRVLEASERRVNSTATGVTNQGADEDASASETPGHAVAIDVRMGELHEDGMLTTRGLQWRSLHVSLAKLEATSSASELMSGFATMATVELQTNENTSVPSWMFVLLAINSTILVLLNVFALMISTFILPSVEAITHQHASNLVEHSPHERLRSYIELAWVLSTVLGMFVFLFEVIILSWTKFWDFSFDGAAASTGIILLAMLIFLGFTLYFYYTLVDHKCEITDDDLRQLEELKQQLDSVQRKIEVNETDRFKFDSRFTGERLV